MVSENPRMDKGNGSVLDIGTWGIPAEARIAVVTTILSPSPPSPTGERAGARWRESNPRSLTLSPLGRGEGMFEQVVCATPAEVRAQFRRVKPLKDISVAQRGWTLDVLKLCWGARPSRSPLATSRCEHLPHRAFGGTPTAAREMHALPISPANWKNSIPTSRRLKAPTVVTAMAGRKG
jgi:hypothetical protein